MTGLSLPTRSLAVSRDRVVIGLSESAGNVWLLRSSVHDRTQTCVCAHGRRITLSTSRRKASIVCKR
jgi:hypothetical protein